MAEAKVTVAVESALHKALTEFMQTIFDEHGIQVREVRVDWLDVSEIGKRKASVVGLQMDTKSFRI